MLSKYELTTCFDGNCMMLCEALSNPCKRALSFGILFKFKLSTAKWRLRFSGS